MVMLIISWVVFGAIVGLIARAVMPGRQSMGALATILLGIAGSFIGGLIGNYFFGRHLFAFHAAGWIGSIVGALVLLAVVSLASSRRRAFAR